MTHIIKSEPVTPQVTFCHDGDGFLLYPTFTAIKLSREEAERLAAYITKED